MNFWIVLVRTILIGLGLRWLKISKPHKKLISCERMSGQNKNKNPFQKGFEPSFAAVIPTLMLTQSVCISLLTHYLNHRFPYREFTRLLGPESKNQANDVSSGKMEAS